MNVWFGAMVIFLLCNIHKAEWSTIIKHTIQTILQRRKFIWLCFHGADEGLDSESSTAEKLKRDSSLTGTKVAATERLRPIGASAEEEVREHDGKLSAETKEQERGGERPVQIIIEPQEDIERKETQERSQCMPPIN